jgi:DNA-binding HxlR family transcriptional regulator
MTDDLGNRGAQDRDRVSASEPHEVRYFATKHGISEQQVLDLIKQHGNDRQALEAALAAIKGPATA